MPLAETQGHLVDTHCHLNASPLGTDVAGVLERARDAGVTQVVVPTYDLASWDEVAVLAQRREVFVAYGLHPWKAQEALDDGALRRRLQGEGVVAVGEIGLDFKVPEPAPARQLEILRRQLTVARDLDLPVLLHCRGAFEELLDLVQEHVPHLRGVLHAFSRGPELAQRVVDLGLHVAFGGAITRHNARRAQRAATQVPLDRVLVETDAPSIGLEGVTPAEVEPRHVATVARRLAALRDAALEEIAHATTGNATRLFGLG